MSKRIKNEQWSVKELVSKIKNGEINKPKFQRKKKWCTISPYSEEDSSNPSEKAYIKFLYDTENSVHAITFSQESLVNKICFSNIDGNNRINAICNFIDKPFKIFGEYLYPLTKAITEIYLKEKGEEKDEEKKEKKEEKKAEKEEKGEKEKLLTDFRSLSYNEIMNFKYSMFFKDYKTLYSQRDLIETIIDGIQIKLKMKNLENFDSAVKINVNLFEGYNIDELCNTFENINKYDNKLTDTELLACTLYNECDFEIADNVFKTELVECIKEYYITKAADEALTCYKYETNDIINAHDFIVGFQNLCNKKYPSFIAKTDVDGLSLYFKLYKALYGYKFTKDNVNEFKERVMYSCDIFNQIMLSIFTDNINDKLFNSTCGKKIQTLKKNNIFMVLSCIIGFKNNKTDIFTIKKSLEKCLLYHFMISDVKNKEKIECLKQYDSITYKACGGFVETMVINLLSEPENISNKITKELFNDLLQHLYIEANNPHERKLENGKNKNDRRRTLKFFEKTIMFYYYKEKIPSNMLENKFSIEHICPNSSEWDGELDKDRTGNLIPIISTMNNLRGNKHINEYSKADEGKSFCEFIKDIIPETKIYNNIVSHDKKPTIKSIKLYNSMCDRNEERYSQNFIDCLLKKSKQSKK